MGHCNHSLPSSIYHSPHVEHFLSLLLDFSWPQTTSLAFLYHWVWKASWSTAVLKNSILQSHLSNKFADWMCFGDEWCLMDAFRLNYFIRFGQVHSNNRCPKFHDSIRKVFECMDHNLVWLYFSENSVCDGSAYVIHCRTNTMTYSRTLNIKSGLKLSAHTITLQSINGLFQTADWCYSIWSKFSVSATTHLFLMSFVTPLK